MRRNRFINAKPVIYLLMALLLLAGCAGEQQSEAFQNEASFSPASQPEEISEIQKEEAEEARQPYVALFEGDRVVDVCATIDEADWQSIMDAPLEKEYHRADIVFNGIVLENVAISTKGNSSLTSVARSESDRYSFRIKFDKYEKGQTLLGLDKISLNNNYKDPSYMREYLHYEAMREAGAAVPLTLYVNLYINGELHGLYTCVEHESDSFLERYFGEDWEDGVFYDSEEASTLQYVEGGQYEELVLDSGTDDGRRSLIRFIQVLNEMPDGEKGEIESVLDVGSALSYIAANTVFGNYDSYHGSLAHNYRLYGDAEGVFTVVSWDMNESFGLFSSGRGGQSGGVSLSLLEPVQGNVSIESRPLIRNLLAVPEYRERYLEYVSLYTDYLERVETRAAELAELIRPHVEADPTRLYELEDFEASLKQDAGTSYLTTYAIDRAARIRELLDNINNESLLP